MLLLLRFITALQNTTNRLERSAMTIEQATQAILDVLLNKGNNADDNKLIESRDDWDWTTDSNITAKEVM